MKQSQPATCQRILDGIWRCAQPLRLAITNNAIRDLPFEQVITVSCSLGHYHAINGVLQETVEPPVDDGPADCWGAF